MRVERLPYGTSAPGFSAKIIVNLGKLLLKLLEVFLRPPYSISRLELISINREVALLLISKLPIPPGRIIPLESHKSLILF
jgi:hypothetical protein